MICQGLLIAAIMFIGALVYFVFILRVKIKRLTQALAESQQQKEVPILMLEIDWNAMNIYLKNDGLCVARDIRIQDVACTLDYDFKKVLTVKFEPVPALNPRERVRLDFKAFDGEYEIPAHDIDSLFSHLAGSSFDVQIFSVNIENAGFVTSLIKMKNKFFVKETRPVANPK